MQECGSSQKSFMDIASGSNDGLPAGSGSKAHREQEHRTDAERRAFRGIQRLTSKAFGRICFAFRDDAVRRE